MKCTRCESQIVNRDNICPNCGADMNITAELINSAINKDNNAYTELYRRTYDDVYREIFVYVKNKDKIEDLVSETYIQAFRRLEQLNKPSSFLPWIRTIGRNKAIDVLRKKNPKVSIDSFDVLNEGCDEKGLRFEEKFADKNAKIPLDEIDRRETHRLMEEILDSIPEEQSCVVKMFYYDEMSIREIAEILGCSENTVKSRLSYGRNKIQQEVLALEKKGTKLYGLAPIPFFVYLLKIYNTIPVKPLSASVLASIESAVLGTTVASTVATTTATVAATVSKGIALKVTAGIVAGVVAVSGGVIGGKKLYDNYKGDNVTKPSTTVTQTMPTTQVPSTVATTVPMTTVHMYKALSNNDTDYIKTLLAYTASGVSNDSSDYSKMTDSEILDVLNSYYMVTNNLKGAKDLFPSAQTTTDTGMPKRVVPQKDVQKVAKEVFGKTLSGSASSDDVELIDGNYYFAVPMGGKEYTLDIKNVEYNKNRSKVTVTYTFNSGYYGVDTTEHTATFTRNGNNKDFPFRINSENKVQENTTTTTNPTKPTKKVATNATTPKTNYTEYKNLKYDGKVVDFGDYTLKVPNSWKYEINEDGQPVFYEPKTKKKGGGAHLIHIRVLDYWDENEAHTGAAFLGSKNGKYFVAQRYMSVEAYMEDGQRVSKKWEDIYNSAYNLIDSVLATFKLK
ncbi:RNA polymerase sigma factor [Ruminococcus sp.]|uniref:RNA polymerase sigma factor n=1 Tax=Ruminococcus sp. TaxID=41978 RepID=UPI00258A6863|nr:sigma-70 family RNA polymerase sigma factor [Ruminococcus sp.]MEE3439130.1 sigma-70 family RNA polymerase sigma factor [Ruminococcus sp.]